MKTYTKFSATLRRTIKEAMQEAQSSNQDGSFDIVIRKMHCEGMISKGLFLRLQGDEGLRGRVEE